MFKSRWLDLENTIICLLCRRITQRLRAYEIGFMLAELYSIGTLSFLNSGKFSPAAVSNS